MGLLRLLSIFALIYPAAFGSKEDAYRSFKCANGGTVQKVWMCDGENDCGDNSDETAPECAKTANCSDDQFRCRDNGRCIPKSLTCDRETDCGDRSDEDPAMCSLSATECLPGMFKCSEKECVPRNWLCDGNKDCSNGLDEANCNRTCTEKEFACGDGQCVDKSWLCDGDYDCYNGKDEEGCVRKNKCQPQDFQCDDGNCIPKKFLCDGEFDCSDRSDESNCTISKIHNLKMCSDSEFQCPDRLTCIHVSWLCDQERDCMDGADESPEMCANSCTNGMFQCNDKQCVPSGARCDGVRDCNDGSDEKNCQREEKFSCGLHEIDCGSGLCLSMDHACNGVRECTNGADESPICDVDECLVDNGGCDHVCVNDPIGHHCKCHEGYQLRGNSSCVDIDECNDRHGSCSQVCRNTIGSYECSCHQGYHVDPHDPTRCKADVKNSFLVFANREDVKKLSLDDEQMSTIVNNTGVSAALDVHYDAQEIYWSDTKESAIFKSDIDGLTGKKVLIDVNVRTVEGLAVDWVHKNIYWTDTGKKTIEVSDLSGRVRKTLVNTKLEEPRALVVDPNEGWMFWTDWGKNARIERAGLDGSKRYHIITHNIKWPNGLTLDYEQKRLYWVDAKLFAIYSADYDGGNRRVVVQSQESLHHPYSVTVFEDFVYWTDWDTQMVYKADKYDGRHLSPVNAPRSLQNPMVIQVYHPYRQRRQENSCAIASCSHLCLPTPKGKLNSSIICACPDDMLLSSDLKTCILPITQPPPPPSSPTARPPTRLPPIYIDFVPPENPSLAEQAREINWLLVVIIILAGSFLTTFVLVAVCACAYKLYLHGNFKMMNFDNPIYHKTPTQDPLCSVESTEPSAPSTPGEEVRQPFCPV